MAKPLDVTLPAGFKLESGALGPWFWIYGPDRMADAIGKIQRMGVADWHAFMGHEKEAFGKGYSNPQAATDAVVWEHNRLAG